MRCFHLKLKLQLLSALGFYLAIPAHFPALTLLIPEIAAGQPGLTSFQQASAAHRLGGWKSRAPDTNIGAPLCSTFKIVFQTCWCPWNSRANVLQSFLFGLEHLVQASLLGRLLNLHSFSCSDLIVLFCSDLESPELFLILLYFPIFSRPSSLVFLLFSHLWILSYLVKPFRLSVCGRHFTHRFPHLQS